MMTRIISAFVALIIFVPLIIIGKTPFLLCVFILSILALKEFLDVKETKKKLPDFIKFISYILITLIVFGSSLNSEFIYAIDLRIVCALFLIFLIPTVLYHDKTKYSVNDALFLIGSVFFLGMSFSIIELVRNLELNYFIYLILISIFTDTFAYITGLLIGKNKLLESVSPKKTWEGMIGGTIMGTFIASLFFETVIVSNLDVGIVILMTLFLSIIGQFGDLTFSAIKRYFGKKDFSNIMPGHGGVLDRLDSIIFIALAFMFFLIII